MRAARALFLVCGALATVAHAADEPVAASPPAATRAWSFAITAYPTHVRDGEHYTSVIALADHDALHLEARYDYESIGARSAYVGWTFKGGEALAWQVTPIVGGAWGTTKSFVAGAEASLAWRTLDVYVEAEHVPTSSQGDGYLYAWSELGWRPVEWLRVGIVGQRTRVYGNDRAIQRGPFAQVTVGAFTIGVYAFNPGGSDQVITGMIGARF
jgi:hypothetical protein